MIHIIGQCLLLLIACGLVGIVWVIFLLLLKELRK
jgi:hypothetical protein